MTPSLIEADLSCAMTRGTGRPATERMLDAILSDTVLAVGDEFLLRLVGGLSSVLRARYALIMASSPVGSPLLAFWIAREYGARVESGLRGPRPEGFDLEGSAGYQRVLRGLLADGDARSLRECRGVPLLGEGDRTMGHLVTLDRAPVADDVDVVEVLQALAPRVVTELVRHTTSRPVERPRPGLPPDHVLITACAWCERVRDDRRNWRRPAEYVRERMNAGFTHGICPDCLRQHQP